MSTTSERTVRLLAGLPDEVLTVLSRPTLQVEDLRTLSNGLMGQSARETFSRLERDARKGSTTPEFVSGVAAGLLHARRREPKLELVLSGPSAAIHRETAGVVAELIATAQATILLTSYVVQHANIPLSMLTKAVERGVAVTCVLDVKALSGPQVAQLNSFIHHGAPHGLTVLVWSPVAGPSTMHAKVVVVDGQTSLITSANLTARALTENVEVGLVVQDRRLARALDDHFAQLRQRGLLVPFGS